MLNATGTNEPIAASCQGSSSRGVWFRFTPPLTTGYTVSSCQDAPTGTTLLDNVIAIYTSTGGCAGPFTQVVGGCDDDGCNTLGAQAVGSIVLTAGVEPHPGHRGDSGAHAGRSRPRRHRT